MIYNRTTWENSPSTNTPINAQNLNKIEQGISDAADEINEISHMVNIGPEVEEDSRINFIKSKNLFDKDTATYVNGWIQNQTMRLNTSNTSRLFYLPCKPNTTYTISRSVLASSFRITAYDGAAFPISTGTNVDYTVETTIENNSATSITYTTGANAKFLVVQYGINTDTNLQESLATIQIEYGETATSYEPYTINSINVDGEPFSDTLKVSNEVDDKSRVNLIHSRNLFDKNSVNVLNAYFVDGTNNITADTSGNNKTIYIPCKPNTTYTIQKTASPSNRAIGYTTTTPAVGVAVQGAINISANTTTGHITTGNNAQYLVIRVWSSSQDTITYDQMIASVQIEEGTTATPYKPFTTNEINIDNEKFADTLKVGSSIDNRSRVNVLKSKNLLSTSLELGTFSNEGVKAGSTENYRTANMIKVKPNTTYTISINGTAHAYPVYFYTIGGTFVSTATTATFTTPANCEYLNFRCFNADFTSDFANLKVQLEEGSATTYEPYITPSIVVDNDEIYSKGTTIYDGGTTGSDLSSPISFNDSLANYERIEIYYGTSRPYYITAFYSNYGQHQYFEPSLQFYYLNNADSSFYIYITLLTISQSAMELHSSRGSRTVTISSNGTITNTKSTTSSTIKIFKVIGYK